MAEQSTGRPARPAEDDGASRSFPPPFESGYVPPRGRDYDSLRADQEYRQFALTFNIKYWMIIAVTLTAAFVMLVVLLLIFYSVCLLVIHYTIPHLAWLNQDEMARLGAVYSNFAKFAAPTALITNAWLVAYFGTRRWAALQGENQARRRDLMLSPPSSRVRR